MTRPIKNIRKVTHKWFTEPGTLAIAIGQLRGRTLYINRLDSSCNVVERSVAYSASDHLTGYGNGVPADDARRVRDMQGAWFYQFGSDAPAPAFCETHKESR